jgi:hypothetical protein
MSADTVRVIYLAFLDIQPTPAQPTRIRFHLDENHTVSLPSTGPHKPREGLILPYLSRQPIRVSVDASHPVAIDELNNMPVREIQLIGIGGFEYTVRVLVVSTTNRPDLDDSSPSPANIAGTINDSSVCSMDLLAQFLETSPTADLDSRAFALANTLTLDKAVIFLSKLALTETGPSRVPTTSECRDLCYPVSPLSAFIRSISRVYLGADIFAHIRPIFVEICEDAVVLSTKSLADQTLFASLSVRLLTAAIEVVTTKFPLPLCIAIEEAFRLNLPQMSSTSGFLGAYLCANLVRACVAFPDEFQIPVTPESLPLLTKVSSVVVHALIASVDDVTDLPSDDISVTIVNGLAIDVRNKSIANFNALVSKCHSATSVVDFGAVEKLPVSPLLTERIAKILSPLIQLPEAPAEPNTTGTLPAIPPFVALLEEFSRKAFAVEASRETHTHQFHQYHQHRYKVSTHYNPQGPSLS